MIKKILYWIMVVVMVAGAVYSYQRVGFGRKLAMLYQLATGNTAMVGPGGAPPGGGQMGNRPVVGPPGMGPGGEQGQMQTGEMRYQPPQMGENLQGGQMPDMPSEGGQGQAPNGQSGSQGQIPMRGSSEGQLLNFQPGGEGGPRSNFQPGDRRGGSPGGMRPGFGGGGWYKISVRNILPYTFILAFFALITFVIEDCIKRFSRSKSANIKDAV